MRTSSCEVPVILLDGHLSSSLAAIRSLGSRGVPVCVGSHRATAMGLYSRYAASRFCYPSPLSDRAGFIQAVRAQVDRLGKAVLLAFSDSTLLPLLDDSVTVSGQLKYLYPPNRQLLDIAFDKGRTLSLAQELGIPVPETYDCQDIEDVCRVAQQLSFPIVLKPRSTVSWAGNRGVQQTASFAFSESELRKKCLWAFKETRQIPLIQQFVRGEEVGVEFICEEGRPIAVCAHRRIRSASPRGGASVVNETIPEAYCGIGNLARRLLSSLRWNGPAMVEFKICQETRRPQLMEINGRFWGSLPLAVAAGVDFPFLFYRLAMGAKVPSNFCYRTGIKTRSFIGDAVHLVKTLFHKDDLRAILYPTRKQAIWKFINASFTCRPAVFDGRDALPSGVQLIDALNSYSNGAISKLVGQRAIHFYKAHFLSTAE